jgi:TRAP-type C4-dicarboxylate transport system permease small subunit
MLAIVIRYWALVGGVIVGGLVILTAVSATTNLFFHKPSPGDYELAKHLSAIAIFTFLPYCQLVGANVTVDIFTEGMGHRAKSAMAAFSSLIAALFALLLLRQMSYGFADYIRYPETTATLGLPLWTAFPPMLFSLLLLFVAALITGVEGLRGMRGAALLPPKPVIE